MIGIVLAAFAVSISAAHVHSYTRKDGTHVSGYNTGSNRAIGKDIDITIGAIVTGFGLIVGIIWWLASSASSGTTNRQDARLAMQREREGVLQKQVLRAQIERETKKGDDPIEKGFSLGQEAQRALGTQTTRRTHPFKPMPLVPRNWLMQIFGRLPTQNAFIELNNALAVSDTVRQVSLV